MKVAFLCSNLGFGGIQRVSVTLANHLARRTDMDVDLVVLRGRGEFLPLVSTSVRVIDLNCTSQPLALLSPFSPLLRYLATERPDTVLSFGNSTNNLAAWAKLRLRKAFRLIVSEHSTFGVRMAGDAAFHRWRRTVRSRFLYRQAERCICVSQGVADDLVEQGVVPRGKTKVIYNPIVDESLAEMASRPVEHPWFADGMPPVILAVGRLVRLKGFDDLIRAFALLREKWKTEAHLAILGEGPERERLESLANSCGVSDEVWLPGFRENPYSYMGRSAVVALTSHYEGLPTVLPEALACGTNVVSTDCRSGPREILEDGKWGRLVEVGDCLALARALHDTIAEPHSAMELQKASERFSAERAAESYYRVLTGKK